MKELLTKIQTKIREIDGIRKESVFFSPDPDVLPQSVQFDCVGLKDGQVTRSELPGGVTELRLPVDIILYVKQGKSRADESVMAVLDLVQSVHAQLQNSYLDGYVKDVAPGQESPIQLMFRGGTLILKKTLSYVYEREEG